MTDHQDIQQIYFTLLQATTFDEKSLDYAIVERHIHNAILLSKIGNSGVSIFDLNRKEHLFYSLNFAELLGYNLETIKTHGQDFLDDKIHPGLTTREKEILQLVKQGLLSKEISEILSISIHTVNTHRQRFLAKLEANNSMEAVIFATKLGLLE